MPCSTALQQQLLRKTRATFTNFVKIFESLHSTFPRSARPCLCILRQVKCVCATRWSPLTTTWSSDFNSLISHSIAKFQAFSFHSGFTRSGFPHGENLSNVLNSSLKLRFVKFLQCIFQSSVIYSLRPKNTVFTSKIFTSKINQDIKCARQFENHSSFFCSCGQEEATVNMNKECLQYEIFYQRPNFFEDSNRQADRWIFTTPKKFMKGSPLAK